MPSKRRMFAVGTGYGRVTIRTADREYLITSEEALVLAEQLLDARAELEPVDLAPVARPARFDMHRDLVGPLLGRRPA